MSRDYPLQQLITIFVIFPFLILPILPLSEFQILSEWYMFWNIKREIHKIDSFCVRSSTTRVSYGCSLFQWDTGVTLLSFFLWWIIRINAYCDMLVFLYNRRSILLTDYTRKS